VSKASAQRPAPSEGPRPDLATRHVWTARWDDDPAASPRGGRLPGDRFVDHPRDLKGDNDLLSITRPDVISDPRSTSSRRGLIETNTFNGTAVAQADYGLEPLVHELNVASARLARQAAGEWTAKTPDRPRFVAGAIGPTNKRCPSRPMSTIRPSGRSPSTRCATPTGRRSGPPRRRRGPPARRDHLRHPQREGGARRDRRGARGAAHRRSRHDLVTITDRSGRTLSGQTVEAFWVSIAHARPFSVGSTARSRARDAALRAGAVSAGRLLGELLPERGTPQRLRRVRRAAVGNQQPHSRIRGRRLREHRRRLLRHDARPHRAVATP